nr:uncharacterized protein LOC129385630 [Dermacentor andersoni]
MRSRCPLKLRLVNELHNTAYCLVGVFAICGLPVMDAHNHERWHGLLLTVYVLGATRDAICKMKILQMVSSPQSVAKAAAFMRLSTRLAAYFLFTAGICKEMLSRYGRFWAEYELWVVIGHKSFVYAEISMASLHSLGEMLLMFVINF